MSTRKLLALLAGLMFVAGCATIVTGTSANITFNSEPQGAVVTVAGRVVGTTPITVLIDKDQNQAVTFEKDGYKTFTTQLSTTTNPWFFGNIVIGGLVGSTTDGLSGAIIEYSPDQYYATLVPEVAFGMEDNKPRRIREAFVALGEDIRGDLAAGGGESVDQLLGLLGIPEDQRPISLKVLQKLASETADNLDLANKIIEFYGVE